jgi:hypothetical protein
MLEANRPLPRRVRKYGDGDQHRSRRRHLRSLVTDGAIVPGWSLVVADLAAARPLEGESATLTGACGVTG